MWADPDMDAILTTKGLVWGGIFSSLFVAVDKKGLAHLLISNYGVMKILVCENSFNFKPNNAISMAYSTPTLIHRHSIINPL